MTTSNKWEQLSFKILVFVLMLLVIAIAYPHKNGSFSYRFEVGRPWSHSLITAQYDFPIYKSEEQVRREQADALQSFAPYFNASARVGKQQQEAILHAAEGQISQAEMAYLSQKIKEFYANGILSIEDAGRVTAEGYSSIMVVNAKHQASAYQLSDCNTPRAAYDVLLAGSPEGENTRLNRIGLNGLLIPNLLYDSATTATMHQKLLAEVTETCGLVQQGEKIIDRGEIVDADTYQILLSLKRVMEERGIDTARANWMFVGTIALFALFITLLALYLQVFRPQLFADIRALLFFCLLMTVVIVLACAVTRYTPLSIYIVPFAWVPVITRVFYDSRTALYMHMITVLICSFLAPVPFEFLVLQMAAGMVAVASLKDMAQRSQLFQTTLWIMLTYMGCYTAFILATKGGFMMHWHIYIYFVINGLLVVCSYIIIYLFEKTFRLVSNVTLVELTNINSDLMLEFAEKAPGSFQHSLQVSNMAMEAAKPIGANALLVRAGALYHDIGKMSCPQNFIENQQDGHNPLSAMSYEKAASVVINHVREGIRIAEEHDLPEVVIAFIRMHHGSSKTRFFYNSYVNAHPGEPVDESLFQYPGPKPNTKETAIVMMADAVEARSRSLQEYTEESISIMVDRMIGSQMADGQFEETPLTFHDVEIIKEVFTRKLISMNHHRIAYPELKF